MSLLSKAPSFFPLFGSLSLLSCEQAHWPVGCHLELFPLVVHSHGQQSCPLITAWHGCHNLGCPLNLGLFSVFSCCCTHVHAPPCHCLSPTDHSPVLGLMALTMLVALNNNKALTFVPTVSPLRPPLDRASSARALTLELASGLLLWIGDHDRGNCHKPVVSLSSSFYTLLRACPHRTHHVFLIFYHSILCPEEARPLLHQHCMARWHDCLHIPCVLPVRPPLRPKQLNARGHLQVFCIQRDCVCQQHCGVCCG
jgi:hypothetical protein